MPSESARWIIYNVYMIMVSGLYFHKPKDSLRVNYSVNGECGVFVKIQPTRDII